MLLKHIHGTQGIGIQFVAKFSMIQAFPPFYQMPYPPTKPKFLHDIIGRELSSTQVKVLGKENTVILTSSQLTALAGANLTVHSNPPEACRYSRIMINDVI